MIDAADSCESMLSPDIRFQSVYQNVSFGSVMLTGTTGFLGPNILHDLLTKTPAKVSCLVRAKNPSEAFARVRSALEAQSLWSDSFEKRISVVLADLAQFNCGVSAAHTEEMAGTIDTLFHCAASVNLMLPYRALRRTNVHGTHEVLRLASRIGVRAFFHVSSISALPLEMIDQPMPVKEDFRLGPGTFATPYGKSKWVSEQLVNAASENGIGTSIFRPGMITGHSATGICNPRDRLSLLLASCLHLNAAPALDEKIHVTPVDYVSNAIVELSRSSSNLGRAFHLINPEALSWTDVLDLLYSGAYVRRTLEFGEWLTLLRRCADQQNNSWLKIIVALLSKSARSDAKRIVRFDVSNTVQGLVHTPQAPPFADGVPILKRYLAHLCSSLPKLAASLEYVPE